MTTMDRRSMLKSGAALAAASAFPATSAEAQTPLLRRSVGTMAANDPALVSYRKAIAAMKALPASDNRNWTKQAQIHLNHCPHGNWYFLPWHRAYLVAFERICRQMSGDPKFALPYWDWTSNRQLPATFTSPTYNGQPNQLYNASRTIPANHSLPDNMVGPGVISSLLAEPSFEVFGSGRPAGQNNTNVSWQRAPGTTGPLEGNPHNRVHGTIGGDMGTYMSPLDPIFWLHHCNIDRLWQNWNDAKHANTADPLWRNFAFNNNFWQLNGTTPYNVAVSGLQNIESLGYRYKLKLFIPPYIAYYQFLRYPLPRPIDIAKLQLHTAQPSPMVMRSTNIAPARLNTVLSTSVSIAAPNVQRLSALKPLEAQQLSAAATVPQAAARVVAIIGDVDPPKTGNAEVRVFVNCDYLSPDTPTSDPSYAGTFTFFGGEHQAHGGKPSYLIDLTNAITNLRRAQKSVSDKIDVQLMPVSYPGGPKEGVEFKPGFISVVIV